jgi:hypothetical protein
MNDKGGYSVFQSSVHVQDLRSHIQFRNAGRGYPQNLRLITAFHIVFSNTRMFRTLVKWAVTVYGEKRATPTYASSNFTVSYIRGSPYLQAASSHIRGSFIFK